MWHLFWNSRALPAVEVTRKDTLTPCAVKILCYNADTSRNKLSPKGLPVYQTAWLFRTVRLICLFVAVATFGVPAESLAAGQTKSTSTSRSTTTAKKRLTRYRL